MIAWLGGWLKNIILVIMLATFVDLLLPSRSMQRYVKLVLSLFILLTILSPIIRLLSDNDGWSKLVDDAEVGLSAKPQSGMESVPAIMQAGNKLRESDLQQAKRLVENKLQQMIKEDIENELNLRVSKLDVTTQVDDKGASSIASVRAVISERGDEGSVGSATKGIKPIDPVRIEIKVGQSSPSSEKPSDENGQQIAGAKAQEIRNRVEQLLDRKWQVSSDKIVVSVEQAGDDSR